MKRVAWFTPLPPVRSGIARYSVELLSRLGHRYEIDVFVDAAERQQSVVKVPRRTETGAGPGEQGEKRKNTGSIRPREGMAQRRSLRDSAPVECSGTFTTDYQTPSGVAGVFSAHDFVWKHDAVPYALIVYQLGNALCHDYMWPYLARFPGLVALHDGQLHHSRARRLLERNRPEHYRAEFRYNHPDADPCVAELSIDGLLGALVQFWSMRRVVLASSRSVLVHNARLAEELHEEEPSAAVDVVEMGVPEQPAPANMRAHVRTRLGLSTDTVLFAAFGKVTPEKRIAQAQRALATLAPETPWHLMLCGEPVGHYDPHEDAQRLGITDRVTVTGYIDEDEMPGYLAAADICFCLRWPSSRETSASWLRCMAAGKPTIVTDLVHLTDVPSLDPRPWLPAGYPAGRNAAGRPVQPACISIDILDEDHSLGRAVRRIATDRNLRQALGRTARLLWTDRFTLERMVSGYERAMERVCGTAADSPPRRAVPRHLRSDGTELASSILEEFGLDNPQ